MLGGSGITINHSGEGVRELLIKATLNSLKDYIGKQLDNGWEIKVAGQNGNYYPLAQWGEITIRRWSWPKLPFSPKGPMVPVEVKLSNVIGNWKSVRIAVVVPRFGFPDPGRANLTAALLSEFPDPASDNWCIASERLKKPFDNWWDKKFLIDFGYAAYQSRAPFEIKMLGDRLVTIARAVANEVPVEWGLPTTILRRKALRGLPERRVFKFLSARDRSAARPFADPQVRLTSFRFQTPAAASSAP